MSDKTIVIDYDKTTQSTSATENLTIPDDIPVEVKVAMRYVRLELARLHERINYMQGLAGDEDITVGGTVYTFRNGILVQKV